MVGSPSAGPWSVGPSHVVAQRTTDDQGRRTTRFVAEALLSAPFVEGEREANARLIAAAPDLYDVLTRLLHELEWVNEQLDLMPDDYADALTFASAALAKARGDAPSSKGLMDG